ncbi:MAG: adenylate kinase [Segniliparus sp.]|uniref:adenylate kinase n=1 Tax=Segniliparus sp. TaxID=2804064 RepID=UPI003F2D597F
MTRVIMFGLPGAGKGTQSVLLAKSLGVPHVSTGDLFRANIGENTPLGQEAKKYLDAGQLVPSSVTNAMVKDRLSQPDAKDGFILDGYPRTLDQAEALAGILDELDQKVDTVLSFVLPEDIVVERMLSRGRADDTEEIIKGRLAIHKNETEPLLDFYKDLVVSIDAVGSVDEVQARALAALGK